tara:strand:+ start:248 stop:1447 length:1200 start_codon:yes stop_codon:yes gene_type:complete
MPVTSHKNYSQGKLTLKEIRKKETKDHNGNVIKFLQALMNYDHPVNGSQVRGAPYFELCPCTTPTGFVKEGYKLSSFTTFDVENEEVRDCIDIKERTEINGWVKSNKDVEVDMGIKSCTATALQEVIIYDSPESESRVTTVPADTVMIVVDQNDTGTWLLVKTGGKDGFFTKLYADVAQIIYDNRAACGLASLSKLEDVKGRMKAPVYWHRDKDTGAFVEGKNPSTYLKHTYFNAQPARGDKPAMSQRYADFKVPGSDESLGLEVLLNSAITFRPVVTLTNVYIGAGKITPQFYVSSAVVTDIKKIERAHAQQDTLLQYGQDKDLVEKLRQQLEASKGFAEERREMSPTRQPATEESEIKAHGTPDLESMLTGGPKIEKVSLDIDNQDDDIQIPGLPTL